jgi:hypothetical protein
MIEKNIFKIFTGAIETLSMKEGDSVSHRIRGIASGTSLDAEGDRMSEKALKTMESQIVGLTLHKDHVFKVDNTLGHFVNAGIKASPDGDVRELWVEAELEPFDVNPDAKRVYDKIKSGTRLGFSIAGILKEWEKADPINGKERFLITDLELVSVDLVTIPAYRASQGSVSVLSEKADSIPDSEIYVCKQLGKIIRDLESDVKSVADEPVANDLELRIAALERKVIELEEKLLSIPIEPRTVDPDTEKTVTPDWEKVIERIGRIEARVVDPPKSKGLMVHPDGRVQDVSCLKSDEKDIEAFEKGSGILLGSL